MYSNLYWTGGSNYINSKKHVSSTTNNKPLSIKPSNQRGKMVPQDKKTINMKLQRKDSIVDKGKCVDGKFS